jgi:hypothetical protein
MSQQEFESQSQSYRQDAESDEQEIYQPHYPYSWSGKLDKEVGPRDEPPVSYTEPTIQRGYQAQDYADYKQQQETYTDHSSLQSRKRQSQQYYSPDGDAFEYGYRPYNRYNTAQGVPPWARPQHHRGGAGKWILFLILGLLLIKPILILMGILLAFVGVAILAFVLPFLLLIAFIGILMAAFRLALWSGRSRYRRRPGYWYWRGPWGI